MQHYLVEAPFRVISINVRAASVSLAVVALTVVVLGWLREFYILIVARTDAFSFLRLFDTPSSLTNWLQPVLLLIAAAMLGSIAVLAKQDADEQWRRWAGLAFLFVFMSVDEAANIDGHIANFVANQAGTNNPVLVLSPFVVTAAALGMFFAPLLFRIPRRDAFRFTWCAGLFVGGALGMEIVSQLIGAEAGKDSTSYVLAASIEETLETCGAALFCIALADYASTRWRGLSIVLSRPKR